MRWFVVAACAAGCGGARAPAATANASVLAQLAVGCDVGIVTQGGAIYVFDHDQASVIRNGEVIARAGMPGMNGKPAAWEAAAAIAAPDGKRWAVGLAGGGLWRVTTSGELESVDDRLGIAGARVLAIAGSGGTFAIGLTDGVAVSRDGHHLMRFGRESAEHVAAARDRVALAHGDTVDVLDLVHGTQVSYRVGHVDALAFLDAGTEQPRLVVATEGVVYLAERGTLRKLALPASPRQVAASGSRLWMLGDGNLYSIASSPLRVAVTLDRAGAHIFSTSAGDVWLATGAVAGKLQRYSLDGDMRAGWQAVVAPIFDRVCSKCHRPGGSAEIDLSTLGAWLEQADSLRHELLARSMPPPEAEVQLTDADRLALERWLER